MSNSNSIRRIKIVHLVTSLEVGGAQHNMIVGLPRLDPERYEHVICSISDRMQMAEQFRSLGFKVVSLGASRKSDLAVVLRLRALLMHHRPDILHTYLIHGNVLGRVVGRLVGVPKILSSELTIGQTKLWGRIATKLTNPLVDAVEVNSETGGKAIAKSLGVPTEMIEVVLPGLDIDAFGSMENRDKIRAELGVDADKHLVLYIGRLRPVKGTEYGIKAFARAVNQNPNMHMALAGEGDQLKYLRQLVYELGIEEKISFLGVRNDLPELLSSADCVLIPSLTEGFPRTAVEAMAAGRAVIATRVGGIPEAITHDETGILVPVKDVDAMATALVRLAGDKSLQAKLGAVARRHVEQNYSVEKYVARLDDIYSRLSEVSRSRNLAGTGRE
jgi:glycosyltransferase involved in cell wall biosynthesis